MTKINLKRIDGDKVK